jgi:hypothetical protein
MLRQVDGRIRRSRIGSSGIPLLGPPLRRIAVDELSGGSFSYR